MTSLTLDVLGTFAVARDGAPVTRFRGDKVRALLAYLVTEADGAHRRAALAALLWPDQEGEGALRNLSQTLLRLRQALGDTADPSPLLDITRAGVRWRGAGAQVDVRDFARLAHSTDPADLARAAALYRGEFLPGFALPDADTFEEWLQLTRAELQQQALTALQGLATHQLTTGRWAEAATTARRAIALDPWREAPHRQLMQALAAGGDRAAALAQFERCRTVLTEELGVEPSAETRLLHERILAGEVASPTVDLTRPRPGLPASLTPLVGREADLRALAALGQRADARLVTLVGAGGMGKTRLALDAARAAAGDYPDGAAFVPLAPLGQVAALPSAIARALGVTLHGGDPAAALLHAVRDRRMLLVLDNAEHLLDGAGLAELVVALLEAAPGVRMIATSRQPLGVRGEHVYGVEGVEHAGARAVDGAGVSVSAAARLFLQCAGRARPGFVAPAADVPVVERIGALVQGMPLALEMAAAWIGLLPPREIAAEIARGLDFLRADWADAPERQRSVRAVFDWSWRLLSAAEQVALRRLSVCRGGFTREAAEVVAGASLRVLAGLAHKSLIRRLPEDGGRYEIHELLRQFAAEQLVAADGERAAVEARHGAFYLAFVAARERRLARDEPREAAAEIQSELDNVRQAWAWAGAHAAAAPLERAAYGWWQFCVLQGLEGESRQLFGLAADHLHAALDRFDGDDAARQSHQRALSVVLAIHANYIFNHGPYDLMAVQAREAQRLGAASGSVEGETLGAYVVGRALQELGQHREARTMWERTIERARAARPRHASGEMLHEAEWLAHIWLFGSSLFFEDYAGGRAHVEEALRLCQALGKRRGEMVCLSSLAMIDFYTGDDVAARRRYEQVIPLTRALDDRWAEKRVQRDLSEVLRVQGDYAAARALLGAVVTVARELDARYDETLALAALTRLHVQLGDGGGARAWHAQLAPLLDRAGVTPDARAAGLRARALYALHTGDPQRALADADEGARLTARYDNPTFRAEASVILGHARAAMGQPAAAAAAYEQALSWYAVCGNAPLTREPRAALAQLALARDDLVGAVGLVEALLPGLAEPPRACVRTPFYADLVCYRVLEAAHDPRAGGVLHTAMRRVHACADRIDDAALRRSFLDQVDQG